MRWKVEGADPVTGSDQLLNVEALTAEEAERQARYNGLLVSRVYAASARRADTPVLLYATPARAPESDDGDAPSDGSAAAALPVVPEYHPITRGARWLTLIARGLFGLSALAAVASACAVTVGVRHVIAKLPSDYLTAALWLFAAAVAGCVGGVLLRTLAAVALAVRDIARNSYRRQG
jgi:hypothetical protein